MTDFMKKRQAKRRMQVESLEPRQLLAGDAFRSFDGAGNNELNPEWGSVNAQLLRLATVEYEDGKSEPAGGFSGEGRANPRTVSNLVASQSGDLLNDRQLTSFMFQWGQFLDHDLSLTEDARPEEPFPIVGPGTFIPVLRSRFDASTGTDASNPRQQINQITAFVDASNVYGSDETKAAGLRTGFGGQLLTSEGDLLPFNYEFEGEYLENAAPPKFPQDAYFIAGDIRANEQPALTSMHTLFVREHNYQAERLAGRMFPNTPLNEITEEDDELIYQRARAIVGAEIQAITYNEFLPALLGPDQLESYSGYDPTTNAGIANIFSGALYRVGHTMLPNAILRLDDDPATDDDVPLGEAFFEPSLITDYGIEPYLKGLAQQNIQEIDGKVVDGVRNLLFDPPAMIDLVATNLQRGRDHGLPDYNQALEDFGLPTISSFDEISSDPAVAAAMQAAYGGDVDNIDVDNIDVWMGAVTADHVPGGSVGELIQTVLVDQFTRLRDGDRFYFENKFGGRARSGIQNTRLSDVILRNTSLTDIQAEVFRDESVLVYRAPAGRGAANVVVAVNGDDVQVTNRGGRVLASAPRGDTSRVVIFGTNRNDVVTVSKSAVENLTAPLEIHGGGGVNDRLIVEGTSAEDQFAVHPTEIQVNDLSIFYGGFERLTAEGGAGNDEMSADGFIDARLVMSGGSGDDVMTGGESPVILLGDRGQDELTGSSDRDFLFGGLGGDTITGGGGEDVLVGGRSRFHARSAAWDVAQVVWQSDMNYQRRARLLRMSLLGTWGPYRTVIHDASVDSLLGGGDRDWFFVRPGMDQVGDRVPGEWVN